MSFYTLTNTISLQNVSSKTMKRIALAANIAEESDFDSSKRLGATLQYKGTCFLRG